MHRLEKTGRLIGAEHYAWGAVCDGWHLLKRSDLSVIEEHVPPGAAEPRHRHAQARQFFYILSGSALLAFDDGEVALCAGEGASKCRPACHIASSMTRIRTCAFW